MAASWKLQDAKDKFSEVVSRAMKGEPQRVTRRGQDAVVVASAKQFDKMDDKDSKDFVKYLLSAPKVDFTPPGPTKWPKRKHPFE